MKKFIIFICLFSVVLWGCENHNGKPHNTVIEDSIVSISNGQNSDEKAMYFSVSVEDYGQGILISGEQ